MPPSELPIILACMVCTVVAGGLGYVLGRVDRGLARNPGGCKNPLDRRLDELARERKGARR